MSAGRWRSMDLLAHFLVVLLALSASAIEAGQEVASPSETEAAPSAVSPGEAAPTTRFIIQTFLFFKKSVLRF
jgi:hypothetical protein